VLCGTAPEVECCHGSCVCACRTPLDVALTGCSSTPHSSHVMSHPRHDRSRFSTPCCRWTSTMMSRCVWVWVCDDHSRALSTLRRERAAEHAEWALPLPLCAASLSHTHTRLPDCLCLCCCCCCCHLLHLHTHATLNMQVHVVPETEEFIESIGHMATEADIAYLQVQCVWVGVQPTCWCCVPSPAHSQPFVHSRSLQP
jgi:hypothetical protein